MKKAGPPYCCDDKPKKSSQKHDSDCPQKKRIDADCDLTEDEKQRRKQQVKCPKKKRKNVLDKFTTECDGPSSRHALRDTPSQLETLCQAKVRMDSKRKKNMRSPCYAGNPAFGSKKVCADKGQNITREHMKNLGIDCDEQVKNAERCREDPIIFDKPPVNQRSSQQSRNIPYPSVFKTFKDDQDPLRKHLKDEFQLNKFETRMARQRAAGPSKEEDIQLPLEVRDQLGLSHEAKFPREPYAFKETKKQKEAKAERRRKAEIDRNFCKYDILSLQKPPPVGTVDDKIQVASPKVSSNKVKVFPRVPSASPSQGIPETPTPSKLQLRKPKSGIIINEKNAPRIREDADSFDLAFQHLPRPKREPSEADFQKPPPIIHYVKKSKKDKRKSMIQMEAIKEEETRKAKEKVFMDALMKECETIQGGEDGDIPLAGSDAALRQMIRKEVERVSKATSLNSKELAGFFAYEEEDLSGQPYLNKIVQKFRRDSEANRYKPPPRKIKRGTFESHSYTNLKQKTLKDFYFGLMMGTINQSDEQFGESSRGVQGICMSVAAYCYAMILHPTKWTELIIDDIVDQGDKFYTYCLGILHNHEAGKSLTYKQLDKYCFIGNYKIKFEIAQPEIIGQIRSTDKKVYNLSKGLQLFFQRQNAGIFLTEGLTLALWKDKHYYMFDAIGRKKDFSPDESGVALMASFYDVQTIATVLLDYAGFGNWNYSISKISIFKVSNKCAAANEEEEEEEDQAEPFRDQSQYNILNEAKAVLQGSFDLGDLCFDFARNKQAISIAAVSLVYSRITPPNAWHKTTVDKIMIIGNQLYLELVESERVFEMSLEHLPASFTIGPYVCEIFIYSNVSADVMYKHNDCMLNKALVKFFKKNSMALVYIGKNVLAFWKQRDMFYCFDPYSRNREGFRCRNGKACVTMNSTIDMLMKTVTTNFDNKDDLYYVHALKVIKIRRDANLSHTFPKAMCMDEFPCEAFKTCKMVKKNKKALKRTITANFGECAVRKLLPWNFLEGSVVQVASNVESITKDQMPKMVHQYASRAILRGMLPVVEKPIDLDSPSLSDTQIEPDRPEPIEGDNAIDLDNWQLTVEEVELAVPGEGGEGEGEDGGLKDIGDVYMALNQYSQVHEDSLDEYHKNKTEEVNTDITFQFLPCPRDLLPPTDMRYKQRIMKEKQLKVIEEEQMALKQAESMLEAPKATQSIELAKESNFINLPDNTQLVRGTSNIASFGGDIEYMAPFVCMMAAAVAQKYAVISWSPEIIDYTLQSGAELYKLSKVRFDQVPILEVPKVSLGKNDYSILSEYLYDTVMKQNVLEMSLEKVLFRKYPCGLVVTPSYACTVFLKNHLYYMFDCFGCNQVGLGLGASNKGAACFARFKNIHDMASRIMYNKLKRDSAEGYEFTRFVLSHVDAKEIHYPKPLRKIKGFGEDEDGGGVSEDTEAAKVVVEPKNLVGYQNNDGVCTIHGTTGLEDKAKANIKELKQDHFVCLCAALMLLCYPIHKWDTKRVDYVLEQGANIFSHADNLEATEKRYIRNILIYQNYFDIIVKAIQIPDWNKNKSLENGIDTVMIKRDLVIIQFPNCSYVFYKYNDEYHIFDPYPFKANDNDAKSESHAGWIKLPNYKEAKKRIRSQVAPDSEQYTFYYFEVASLRKASKKEVLNQRLMVYDMNKPIKAEPVGRAFNEKDFWLKAEPLPWSRMQSYTASGEPRNDKICMWHNWDTEYENDLYSIAGTIHQTSPQFDAGNRGNQTMANLVVAIGMVEIYSFSEWNSSVLDSIIFNGNQYYEQCIAAIKEDDHELALEDLKKSFTIYPYRLQMSYTPFVDGTIFIMRANQFNLYKATRYFCDNYTKHTGIIIAVKGEKSQKRMIAFGKLREKEFFMYDCQPNGPPMFVMGNGSSYILRCKTLKRLVHVLTLTLRGGDFFVYEVNCGNLKPMKK